MRNLLLILIFATTSFSANAALIMEVWSAEVLALNNNPIDLPAITVPYNGYHVGDTVTWTVSYDPDSGDHFTRFTDGNDGISDRGGNDDKLHTLSCLNENYSANCNGSESDNYFTALFDSDTDISTIYETMVGFLGADESVHDYFDFNNDTRSLRTQPYPDFSQHDYYADEFHIYADNRQFPAGGAGYAQLMYDKPNGEIWQSWIGLGNISVVSSFIPSPVPVPATVWLFFSAMLSLIVMRHKKSR